MVCITALPPTVIGTSKSVHYSCHMANPEADGTWGIQGTYSGSFNDHILSTPGRDCNDFVF